MLTDALGQRRVVVGSAKCASRRRWRLTRSWMRVTKPRGERQPCSLLLCLQNRYDGVLHQTGRPWISHHCQARSATITPALCPDDHPLLVDIVCPRAAYGGWQGWMVPAGRKGYGWLLRHDWRQH